MTALAATVLTLGDPQLRAVCEPVRDVRDPAFVDAAERLHATLSAFRAARGFGRAIAAPQIGVAQRFIAVHLGEPMTVVNPQIYWTSAETFTMWDDCLSFPDILVRVRRFAAIELDYTTASGETKRWRINDRATSELLQHEIDHLDGVLAVDRAVDEASTVSRAAFASQRAELLARVDVAPHFS